MSGRTLLPVQQEAVRIARHEFGHHIFSKYFGFIVEDVKLRIYRGGHDGSAVIRLATSFDNVSEIGNYLEKRIMILYAGAYAENTYHGTVDIEGIDNTLISTAKNDFSKLKELMHLLRSITYGNPKDDSITQAQLTAIETSLRDRCKDLVLELDHIIEEAAQTLVLKITNYGMIGHMAVAEINALPTVAARFGKKD